MGETDMIDMRELPADVAGLVKKLKNPKERDDLETRDSIMNEAAAAILSLSAKVKEVEGYRTEGERQYQEQVAVVIREQARAEAAAAALADLVGLFDLIDSRDDLPPILREAINNSHRLKGARAFLASLEKETG